MNNGIQAGCNKRIEENYRDDRWLMLRVYRGQWKKNKGEPGSLRIPNVNK